MKALNNSTSRQKAKGLVIVNTGNGKGKTTAALGLLLRAWGHDMKVIMLQFIKRPTAEHGEHRAGRRLGIEVVAGGAGFTWRVKNLEKSQHLSLELWAVAREKIYSGLYQMVILDELTYPLSYGWLPVAEVLDVLKNRPGHVHVIVTGRKAPLELVELADIVTDMREVKHCLKKGVKAQPGIEC
jgi:cob(I)alamin adenosyltransferase